jgi:Cys-rich repeat protein
MAVSRRFGLGAAIFTFALVVAACGDSEGDKDKDDGGPANSPEASTGNGQDAGFVLPVEIADLDDNVAGKPCTADSECKGTGALCLDGTCSGICESNKDCGAGGSCVQPFAGQNGLCSKVCKENTDCAQGLDCRAGLDFDDVIRTIEDAGISTIDAGIDLRSIPKTCGASLGIVQIGDGVVSTPCSDDKACAPGMCARDVNILEQFPNGYCTGKCLEDKDCGSGGVCYKDPLTAFTNTDGRCLAACSSTTSCKHNLVCRTSTFIDEKSYCLPGTTAAGDAGT